MQKSVLSISAFNQLNIVYGSYMTESIKYGKRLNDYGKRLSQGVSTKPLNICKFGATTITPVQIEMFWANDSNKENLQEVSRTFFRANQQNIM